MLTSRLRRWGLGFAAAALAVLFVVAPTAAQEARYRVLLVDGTKTFTSTMRVVGIAGAIRQSGVADLTVLFADGLGPFDDPLAGRQAPEAPYDLILIIPRGIDDGSATRIWLLVAGDPSSRPDAAQAMALFQEGIAAAFAGLASAVGPLDDLWAALAASAFVNGGWLQ
ncbi:MAG: hypothetical protein AB1778_02740 [Candidatus Bipolaricaulota bacterium]